MDTMMKTRPRPTPVPVGTLIEVVGVSRSERGCDVLDGVNCSIAPGELVGLAGGSGAGKSTLLELIAGLRLPTTGEVLHDGVPAHARPTGAVGFVPQDDIVHRELSLRRTLEYAARLRASPDANLTADDVGQRVDRVLAQLDLTARSGVRVGSLSGGQRKRASIAVELLAGPRTLLLDEPTSGLDPATAADVMRLLRALADDGVTVLVTTHSPADLEACDRVVFLSGDGRVAFDGTPAEARDTFVVDDLADVYRRLGGSAVSLPDAVGTREPNPVIRSGHVGESSGRTTGALRQWMLLTRRTAEVVVRNRLTMAIMLGSPLAVIGMMAMLFRPGAMDDTGTASVGPVQTVFWIAFAGFFFGLTYGLLQIVTERSVLARERFAGLDMRAYVAAKITVLTPVLALVAGGLLGVLRLLDRLPAAGAATYAALFGILVVESAAALALGLLASAAVTDAAQATLTLPMLCFPQVLFAGAVVPVAAMSAGGRGVSAMMTTRWAFESLGRALGLDASESVAAAGYAASFTGSPARACLVLAAFAVGCSLLTVRVLARPSARRARR